MSKYGNFKQEITLFNDIEDMSICKIVLPDPPNLNKIINYKRPTDLQKWERINLPKEFARFKMMDKSEIYSSLTKQDHDFIREEYNKIENGYWFFNHGELTYITGHNYMFLNWWKIDVGHPKYRDVNRRYFLHWDKIEKDPNCYGMIEMTKRRDGKSFRAGCIAYNRTFSYKNRQTGIQSKTGSDAEKFLQKTIASPWKKLPFFLQPNYDNTNNPREALRFFSPTLRGKASQKNIGKEVELESWIEARASVVTAFDGEKLHTSIDDEAGKTIEVNISDRWDVKKICLEVDGVIVGKEIMTTTVEEMEKMGGKYFKEIWNNSDPGKLEANDQTESGLHRHFTPAYDGYIVDDWGMSLISESREELQTERDSKRSSPEKLTQLKRKKPFTIKECFRSAGKECHFNVEIIDNRLEHFTFTNPYVQYGNFVRKNGEKDGPVLFEPSTKEHGKFCVSYLFENPADSNRVIFNSGKRFPNNTTFGMAGGDPFKYNVVVGSRKSKGGGAVFMNHNILIDPEGKDVTEWKTNRFCCTYANRTEDKIIYGNDMINMCVYYGIKMNPEINVPFLWDHFTDRGYDGYLYYAKDNTFRTSKTPGDHTNDKTKDTIFAEYEAYINTHGHREVHPEILEACREADYADLKPSDLFVAGGYALMGAKTSYRLPVAVTDTKHAIFKTYKI